MSALLKFPSLTPWPFLSYARGEIFASRCSQGRELHAVALDVLAHADEGIPHPTECRVDGNTGFVRDFLEAQTALDAQPDDFLLFSGEEIDEFHDIGVDLAFHQPVLYVLLIGRNRAEHIVFIRAPDQGHFPTAAEGVNGQIVSDPHDPRQELPLLVVPALLDGVDRFDEGVLEDIIRDVLVLHHEVDFVKHSLLVSVQQGIERSVFAGFVAGNELLVSAGRHHDIYALKVKHIDRGRFKELRKMCRWTSVLGLRNRI